MPLKDFSARLSPKHMRHIPMNQIHAMRVFVRVAETESFRRAAQQLAVSNALVTRSIATLEAHLKTRLSKYPPAKPVALICEPLKAANRWR
jgi:hypothetical protein